MKYATRLLPLASLFILFPLLQGCGGYVSASSDHNSPPNIIIVFSQSYVTLAAKEGFQFNATVTGTANTAVTWSLLDCTGEACGSISSNGYYSAPSQISGEGYVSVRATTQADPSKFATATVHHVPVVVNVDPASAWLFSGATQKFTASLEHEVDQMGVTWTMDCADTVCGSLTDITRNTVVYTAPSSLSGVPVVTLKAASVKDPSKWRKVAITLMQPSDETLAEGDYAFLFDGWKTTCPPTGCDEVRAAIAGQFHADGKGSIISGIEDINIQSSGSETLPITGRYTVESDHRGILILTSPRGTSTYRMSVGASGREGTFITFEEGALNGLILGSGSFERQDPNAFSLQGIAGPHAFGLYSGGIWGATHQAAIGRFEANAAGALSGGRMDLQRFNTNGPGSYAETYNVDGSFAAPSAVSGRGSATLVMRRAENATSTTLNFAYYVVSVDKIFLIGTDSSVPKDSNTGRVFSGGARRQTAPFSPESLAGPSIFNMLARYDDFGWAGQDAVIGQLVADGRGSLTGVVDSSGNSLDEVPPVSNLAFTASYSVDPDGRVVFTGIPIPSSESPIAYLFGQNQAFFMDTKAYLPRFGRIEPQEEGTFTAGSISGRFVVAVTRVSSINSEISAGWVAFDENGGMSMVMDYDGLGTPENQVLSILATSSRSGKYNVSSNGRGTLTWISSQGSYDQVFWVVSPSKVVTFSKQFWQSQ